MAKKQRLAFTGDTLTVEYPAINKKLIVVCTDLPKEIYVPCEAARHGMKQKFGDAASGLSAAEKYEEASAILASLKSGQWERTATFDQTPLILSAVATLQGLKYDAEKGTLSKGSKSATPTPEQVKEWGANPKVKAEIARARAEKAQKVADESKDELNVDLK